MLPEDLREVCAKPCQNVPIVYIEACMTFPGGLHVVSRRAQGGLDRIQKQSLGVSEARVPLYQHTTPSWLHALRAFDMRWA